MVTQPTDLPDPSVITILGVGQMALVAAGMLTKEDPGGPGSGKPVRAEVRMWGHDPEESGRLAQTRREHRLPEFILPDSVRVCLKDAEAMKGAELIVNAIPVQFIRPTWQRLAGHVPVGAAVVSVSKGVEVGTMLRPTQIIADVLADNPDGPPRPIGAMLGPTIARELVQCMPATMIAASEDPRFSALLQRLFSTSWMRIYTNEDLLGVELAGATKNVIAIAAGILDGLRAGFNAKSALLARGLAEITRLGVAMGASHETFFGLAGVGDLATTCFCPAGRNRSCGEALGSGQTLSDYLKRSACVVEGVETTRSVVELARKYRVEMPITQTVHAVLFEGLDPIEGIGRLMSRELKGERVG